mmetsp:Transcript_33028/g.104437  ORF Transcript_33028/g.104437 Transcript_33028/m.104437 type:complete len:92 (+) Transcript_33028:632-907(+)
MWLYTMLSLVGETYPDSDQICGAVCSLRQKHDRVAVWTKDAQDSDAYEVIGRLFRDALLQALGSGRIINEKDYEYQPHDESLKKLMGTRKR